MKSSTIFIKGWFWDKKATFHHYYGDKLVCTFVVKMKPGFRFENYIN